MEQYIYVTVFSDIEMKIDVYTANEECELAPKEVIGKYFVSLGSQHHNYGKCYELICWINNVDDDIEDTPYVSLLYTFEYKKCKVINQITVELLIIKLKQANNVLSKTKYLNSMYQNYMLVSSERCLDRLLLDYSFYQYQIKMAQKIQLRWIYHYYTPTSEICKRVRMRQFMCLQEELLSRTKYN
jgi:hypothetical protein